MNPAHNEAFEMFVVSYTGRDMEYHARYQTAGIEFARAAWERATALARATCGDAE